MTDDGYYPDLEHLTAEYYAGKAPSRTERFQHPSGPAGVPGKRVDRGFKDYYCPFCGHRLFRGKVRDFRTVCHECNRLVDSRTLGEQHP